MGWAMATRVLPTLASHSHDSPPPRHPKPSRRINGSPPRRKQPSVAEIQRAIGVADDFPSRGNLSSSPSSSPPSFMDLLSSTPIGQPEGPVERKLREAAERMVDQTEAKALYGQQILLTVCLKILPVWFFLLLIASGVIKLPFDLPFMDDLIS